MEDWPIQFIPASKPIEIEAIQHAIEKSLTDGVVVSVPPPEYLMLIALDLCRPKDIMRLHQFHSEKVYEPSKLKELLLQHGLTEQWSRVLELFKIQENAGFKFTKS